MRVFQKEAGVNRELEKLNNKKNLLEGAASSKCSINV